VTSEEEEEEIKGWPWDLKPGPIMTAAPSTWKSRCHTLLALHRRVGMDVAQDLCQAALCPSYFIYFYLFIYLFIYF
jgi:hypothetical protein